MIQRTLPIIIAVTVASYAVGWAVGIPLAMPFLNTLAAFPFMAVTLARGTLRQAIAQMLVWALTMAVCATAMSYWQPWTTDALFLRGAAYRLEMFAWVKTGIGAESSPAQFIPQHALHAALFSALALATGGILAMPMGAVLMNYMGHYAGTLAAASRRPLVTALLAWHPWAIVRIVSFVVIGVVLSAPLWSRVGRFRVDWTAGRRLLRAGAGGLVLDVVMKTLLARTWHILLLYLTGW